jgi:biotin carboxyl carrier protein
MRRYVIQIGDNTHSVDVEELGSQTFNVALADGRQLTARLLDDHDLGQSQLTAGLEPEPAGPPGPGPSGRAVAADSPGAGVSRAAAARVPSGPARTTGGPAAGSRSAGGPSLFEAPMPGVVLSIEVAPGAPVRHGQTLLVLEAMKMKNELKAPRDAIVADVLVAAGQQVKHGDPLIKFEQVQS